MTPLNHTGRPSPDWSGLRGTAATRAAGALTDIGVDIASFFVHTPFPGTEDYDTALRDRRLTSDDFNLYDSTHCVQRHPWMTPEQIEREYADAYRHFYSWRRLAWSAATFYRVPGLARATRSGMLTQQFYFTYASRNGMHPMIGGKELSRSFVLDENRLTITSTGEPYTARGTRWVWDRVPAIDNLSPLYRNVVGFWRHIVEKRVNPTTGVVGSETKRSPSVIVYTPAGFVGVHFPPLNRKPFSGETPTPEEALADAADQIRTQIEEGS